MRVRVRVRVRVCELRHYWCVRAVAAVLWDKQNEQDPRRSYVMCYVTLDAEDTVIISRHSIYVQNI